MIFTKSLLLTTAAAGLLATSCSTIADQRDSMTAKNQMMLVRENPGTLGYRRLMAKSAESGDLKIFIDQTGLPDFLAEADSSDRKYLIFYYLDKRQAFACRTAGRSDARVEFAGPYKMTANELKMLKAVRSKAAQVSANG